MKPTKYCDGAVREPLAQETPPPSSQPRSNVSEKAPRCSARFGAPLSKYLTCTLSSL